MGMIQTLIKKVPDGKTPQEFVNEVQKRLPEYSEGAESAEIIFLTPENFDEHWGNQENLKKTSEVEEKYKALAAAGKAIVVEIDW